MIGTCEEMKSHKTLVRDALALASWLGVSVSNFFLDPANFFGVVQKSGYARHEKWGGNSYLQMLKTQESPRVGGLMSVADIYDASTSPSSYRRDVTPQGAKQMFVKGRRPFLPSEIIAAYVALAEVLLLVARQLAGDRTVLNELFDFGTMELTPLDGTTFLQ